MYDSKYIQTDDNNLHMKKLISFNRRLIMKSTLKSFCLKKYRRGGEGLGALSPESMASADVHYKPQT